MPKIRCQVRPGAKHYHHELPRGKQVGADGTVSKKFAKRQLLCGAGMVRLNGEKVLEGDTIEINSLSELGNFADKFNILNPDVIEQNTPESHEKMTRKKKGLKKVEREDSSGWDVINRDTGLKLNDEALSKKAATAMVKDSKRDD